MLKEFIVAVFDSARQEGMIHSKDSKHSESSDSAAEDVLAKVAEAVEKACIPQPMDNRSHEYYDGYYDGGLAQVQAILKVIKRE